MTLEEGIYEFEDILNYFKERRHEKATKECMQVLEWLKELKRYRESDEVTK